MAVFSGMKFCLRQNRMCRRMCRTAEIGRDKLVYFNGLNILLIFFLNALCHENAIRQGPHSLYHTRFLASFLINPILFM